MKKLVATIVVATALLCSFLLLYRAACRINNADEANNRGIEESGQPPPRRLLADRARALYEADVADEVRVREMARLLDDTLAIGEQIPREAAGFVRLIAFHPTAHQRKPEPIASFLATKPTFEKQDKTVSLLRLALSLARADGSDPENSMAFLRFRDTVPDLDELALLALAPHPPLNALSAILDQTRSSWSFVQCPGVGTPDPKREFPARTASARCLKNMGIKCEVREETDALPDNEWGRRLTTTVVSVDADSLRDFMVAKLEGASDNQERSAVLSEIREVIELGFAVEALTPLLMSGSNEKRG
jgi:hypothetical protein